MPVCQDSVTRIPGQIGWGVERKHLLKKNVIITDDLSAKFPIVKEHVTFFDKNNGQIFDRSKTIDRAPTKLGLLENNVQRKFDVMSELA